MDRDHAHTNDQAQEAVDIVIATADDAVLVGLAMESNEVVVSVVGNASLTQSEIGREEDRKIHGLGAECAYSMTHERRGWRESGNGKSNY